MSEQDHIETAEAEPSGTASPTQTVHGDAAEGDGADLLAPGTHVGRYRIGRPLGEGGMGVVYEAHDPELDRSVALKLVDVRASDESRRERRRTRFVREAQALAQLTHPNVVTVYDVGASADRVYISMELVQGRTLFEYCAEKGRTVGDVVRAYVAAGEGLAAAHRAGIVHRDFKPQNVLVGEDGRVRVIDFGLARAALDDTSVEEDPVRSSTTTGNGRRSALDLDLTAEGAVMGTPRYMSPEQHRGRPTDARSDQYSFCASLYEGVAGVAPFGGRNGKAIYRAAVKGDWQSPHEDRNMPTWVRRLCERGLALEPRDRFPSMDALLVELRRDRAARWRRLGWLALAALPVALIFFAQQWNRPVDRCLAGMAAGVGIFDEAQAAGLESAFVDAAGAYGASAATRVRDMFKSFRSNYRAAFDDACRDTHERYAQSAQMLDARMMCLRREVARRELLISEWLSADREVIDATMPMLPQLADVPACSAEGVSLRAESRPMDMSTESYEAFQRRIDEGSALAYVARFREARSVLSPLVHELRDTGARALLASAAFALANVEQELGAYEAASAQVELALNEAGRARASDVEVSSIALYAVVAKAEGHDDVAAALIKSNLFRFESSPLFVEIRVQVLCLWARIQWEAGRLDEADKLLSTALSLAENRGQPLEVARVRAKVGYLRRIQGRYRESLELTRGALPSLRARLGDEHPETLDALTYLAQTEQGLGGYEAAEASYRRVLEIERRRLGPKHMNVALSLSYLAEVNNLMNKRDEAMGYAEEGLAIMQAVLGDAHPYVASSLTLLANLQGAAGRQDAAVEGFERALSILREHESMGSLLLYTLQHFASFENDRGRHAAARALAEESLKIAHEMHGRKAEVVTSVEALLVEIAIGEGRPSAAVEHGYAALAAVPDAREATTSTVATARFKLAQALAARAEDGDLARAKELVQQGLSALTGSELEGDRALLREIRAFEKTL